MAKTSHSRDNSNGYLIKLLTAPGLDGDSTGARIHCEQLNGLIKYLLSKTPDFNKFSQY
jgi:hypothetical protein